MIDELRKLRELTETLTGNGYLKDRAQDWEYALDAISECIIIVTTKEEIRFVNRPLISRLGTEDKEIFYSSKLSDITGNLNLRSLDSHNEIEVYIEILRGWFICYKSPIFTRSGKLIGYIIVLNDITSRKRAELSLIESEEKFRLSFSSSPDAVYISKLEDGLCVEINGGFTRLIGYTKEDVVGKSLLSMGVWKDKKDRDFLRKSLIDRGYCDNLEAVFVKKDGIELVGLISSRIMNIDEVPHTISMIRDISDRKKLEILIKENEEKYRNLFERSLDPMVLIDTENKIIECNSKARSMFETKVRCLEEAFLTDIFPEFNSKRNIDIILNKINSVKEGNEEVFEISSFFKEGNSEKYISYIIKMSNIFILGEDNILVTIDDISDRRKLEREFGVISNNVRDVIWSLDLEMNFTYVSPVIYDMLGYTVEEFTGTNLSEHCPPEEMEFMAQKAMESLQSDTFDMVMFRTKLYKKDGKLIDVEIHGKHIIDATGKAVGIHGITIELRTSRCDMCDKLDCPNRLTEYDPETCLSKDNKVRIKDQIFI